MTCITMHSHTTSKTIVWLCISHKTQLFIKKVELPQTMRYRRVLFYINRQIQEVLIFRFDLQNEDDHETTAFS